MMRCMLVIVLTLGGCASQASRRIIVPDDQLKQSDYQPDGVVPRSRYVLRMTDGKRDWEVEFPEVASGYEVRIPLEGEPKVLGQGAAKPPTAADREIAEDMVRQNPDLAESAATGKTGPTGKPNKAAPKLSYLTGLSEIRDLFRSRNYELALLKTGELEQEYPADDKLLAMKGSLYRQIGRVELARDAWEHALKINPQNQVVIDALERLGNGPPSEASPHPNH
jgi:tetratricopeptide (TPR) repeat protein